MDVNQIASITLVNNQTGQAKLITREIDIESICKYFNTAKMHRIKNWDGGFKRIGGCSFTYFFTSIKARSIRIGYYDGSYLINNGDAYSIQNTGFEKFWKLKYKETKFNYGDYN